MDAGGTDAPATTASSLPLCLARSETFRFKLARLGAVHHFQGQLQLGSITF